MVVNGLFSCGERIRSPREGYGWGRVVGLVREGRSMPQPAGPQDGEAFVGRSRELAALSAALRHAAAGDARLVLVSGEPGIGKTELARAFARAARDAGALVLWGSAWEDGGAPPYWPWAQALRSYGRQAGAQSLAEAQARMLMCSASCSRSSAPAPRRAARRPGPGSRSSRRLVPCWTGRRDRRRWW